MNAEELRAADGPAFSMAWRAMDHIQKHDHYTPGERTEFNRRYGELNPWSARVTPPNGKAAHGAEQLDIAIKAQEIEHTSAPKQKNLLDWSLLSSLQPPEFQWIMPHWLSWHPTLLAGRGGIGKSLLVQQVCTSLACGLPTWGEPSTPLRVLYWACEDDHDQLWRRQDAICRSMHSDFAALDNLSIDARYGMDNTLMTTEFGAPVWTPAYGLLGEEINDLNIDVLALDNIGHAFGANENVRHDVTLFINGICGLVTGRKFCPIILGHPAKIAGSEYSGSTAWENSVRMRWYLDDKMPDSKPDPDDAPDPNMRILSKRKTNYTVHDYIKFRFDQGVLVHEAREVADPGIMQTLRDRKAQSVVMRIVAKCNELNVVVSDTNSRNYLPSVAMQYKLNEDLTKRELADAMRICIMHKKLEKGDVARNAARRPVFGLKINENI